jgi:hypothetical protein
MSGSQPSRTAFFAMSDLLQTEFYNDWCRPQNVGGGTGITVERKRRRVTAAPVLLSRSAIEQEYGAVCRSQLHRQFAALEARATAAEGALDRQATAMFPLDATGQFSTWIVWDSEL